MMDVDSRVSHSLKPCSSLLLAFVLLPSITRGQFEERPPVTDSTPAKQVASSKWTQRTEMAEWTPRSLHACVHWVGTGVFVLGGFNGNLAHGDLADVWVLPDNATDDVSTEQAWHEVTPSATFSPRHGHSAALWQFQEDRETKFLVVTGGTGGGMPLAAGSTLNGHNGGSFLGDFWKSQDGHMWEQDSAQFPGRSGHTMVVLGNFDLVLMGGISGGLILNDIWCIGPNCELKAEDWSVSADCKVEWCRMAQQAPWDPREDAAASVIPTMLRGQPAEGIVFCGGLGPNEAYSDAWFSTDGGGAWTRLTKRAEWSPRSGHAVTVSTESHVVLFGGTYGGSYMSDVWVSVNAGASWSMLTAAAPWVPRASHCAVTTGQSIMLLGGFDGENDLNDVWSVEFQLADAAISIWASPLTIAAVVGVFLSF